MAFFGGPPPAHPNLNAYHLFDPAFLSSSGLYGQHPAAFHPSTMMEDIRWSMPYSEGVATAFPQQRQIPTQGVDSAPYGPLGAARALPPRAPIPTSPIAEPQLNIEDAVYTQIIDALMAGGESLGVQSAQAGEGGGEGASKPKEGGGEGSSKEMQQSLESVGPILEIMQRYEEARMKRVQEHEALLSALMQSSRPIVP